MKTEAECGLVETTCTALRRICRCRDVEAAALTRQIHDTEEQFDDRRAAEAATLTDRFEDDPIAVAGQLRRTSAGCRWLIDQWEILAERLESWPYLERDQKVRAIYQCGRWPTDVFTDPLVREWVRADLAARHGGEAIGTEHLMRPLWWDKPEELSDVEYDRLIRLLIADLPAPGWGHATLRGLVAAARWRRWPSGSSRWNSARPGNWSLAVRIAAFDATAAGMSQLRYEASHRRALRELRALRNERVDSPEAAAPTERLCWDSGFLTTVLSGNPRVSTQPHLVLRTYKATAAESNPLAGVTIARRMEVDPDDPSSGSRGEGRSGLCRGPSAGSVLGGVSCRCAARTSESSASIGAKHAEALTQMKVTTVTRDPFAGAVSALTGPKWVWTLDFGPVEAGPVP